MNPPAEESCFLCNKSFPVGITFERHVNSCLEAASALAASFPPPIPPPPFGPGSAMGSGSAMDPVVMTNEAYSLTELDADIFRVESLLEKIIRGVDPNSSSFHSSARLLYSRLNLCLKSSFERIGLYSSNQRPDPLPPALKLPVSRPSPMPVDDNKEKFMEVDNDRLFLELMRKESTCSLCNQFVESNLFVESCDHRFCLPCLQREFAARLEKRKPANFSCPVVGCQVAQMFIRTLKAVLSTEDYERLETMQMATFFESSDTYAICPNSKCGFGFERVTANSAQRRDVNETGIDNKPLSPEAIAHRDQFRFRCPQCSENFCSGCKESPYHLGFTCQSYANYKNAKHCRYCEEPLTRANTSRGGGPGVSGSVCIAEECQAKKALACGKLLICGHPCCGIKDENPCVPCLETDCKASSHDKDEYCGICFTESLGAAPCIQTVCGHIFHFSCLEQKLSKKWPGSRITFNFLSCPLCKQTIDHPSLRSILEPHLKMLEEIRGKAKQRLTVEGMDKDKELTDPNSRYFGKAIEYAMDKLAYYPCFKCKQPYFGGRGRCEAGQAGANAANPANNAEAKEDFDASHLVCGGCSDQGQECQKHGKEYIEWKCKFCCNISSWFCWGNTHFCESCHTKQVAGDYMTKKKPADLPKCPGSKECPLKGNHPPPGSEVCIGCAMCRYVGNF